MKVLVTGATGAIGKCLVKNIDADIYPIATYDLDLTNKKDTREFILYNKFDAVIHCAMSSDPLDSVKMARNVVDALKGSGAWLVNIASGSELGDTVEGQHELGKPNLNKFDINKPSYSKSKRDIYDIVNRYAPSTSYRLFGTFCSDENETRFFKQCINNIKNGNEVLISKDIRFTFFSTYDLANLINQDLYRQDKIGVVNLSYHLNNPAPYLSEYARLIADIIGKPLLIKIENEGPRNAYYCSNLNAQEHYLKNADLLGIEKSIERMISELE